MYIYVDISDMSADIYADIYIYIRTQLEANDSDY